jgi:hypothetical protein
MSQISKSERRTATYAVASEIFGISVSSLRRLTAAKELTVYRPVPGRVVLDLAEVEAFVKSHTATPRKGRGIRRAKSASSTPPAATTPPATTTT